MNTSSIVRSLLSIVFIALVLTSCGEQQPSFDEEFKNTSSETSETQEFKGTVEKSNDAVISDTIFTKQSDGKIIYLDSKLIALEKFYDKEVLIRGYFKDEGQQLFYVLDAISVDGSMDEEESTEEEPTKKAYNGEGLGVYFVHPSTWEVDKIDAGKVEVRTIEGNDFVFDMYKVDAGNKTLESWLKTNYPGKEYRDRQVGTEVGKRVVMEDSDEVVLAVKKGGSIYNIHYNYKGTEDTAAISRAFAELQNTLRFFAEGEGSVASPTTSEVDVTEEPSEVMSEKESETVTSIKDDDGAINIPAEDKMEESTTTPDIVAYFKSHTSDLPSDGEGTPEVLQVETAGDSYVYVTYQDGEIKKKVLFAFTESNGEYTLTESGLFEEGESTDWVRVSGSNVAANEAREVFNLTGEGDVEKAATLMEGKSLYTNSHLDFQTQYPRNWYYAGRSISSEGGIQEVTFSNKPYDALEEPDQKVVLRVYKESQFDVSDAASVTIRGKEGYSTVDENGNSVYAIKTEDGRVYTVASTSDELSMEAKLDILGSIE